MSEPVDRHVRKLLTDPEFVADLEARRGNPDPLRPVETDDIYVEPYVADRFPVGWDVLAAVVIAGACIAYVLWRWA